MAELVVGAPSWCRVEPPGGDIGGGQRCWGEDVQDEDDTAHSRLMEAARAQGETLGGLAQAVAAAKEAARERRVEYLTQTLARAEEDCRSQAERADGAFSRSQALEKELAVCKADCATALGARKAAVDSARKEKLAAQLRSKEQLAALQK